MYHLEKRMEIAGSHSLKLGYESKCTNMHGHNWIIIVRCQKEELDINGMICDFGAIKNVVMKLDHEHLNNIIEQPTAENIAKWIFDQIPYCNEVEVQESEGNSVFYTGEENA